MRRRYAFVKKWYPKGSSCVLAFFLLLFAFSYSCCFFLRKREEKGEEGIPFFVMTGGFWIGASILGMLSFTVTMRSWMVAFSLTSAAFKMTTLKKAKFMKKREREWGGRGCDWLSYLKLFSHVIRTRLFIRWATLRTKKELIKVYLSVMGTERDTLRLHSKHRHQAAKDWIETGTEAWRTFSKY